MADKEKLILDAASEVFLKYGYKKTSIEDVAAHAKIGKGTVYNYFGSKEELFVKLAQCQQERLDQEFQDDLERYPGDNDPLTNYMIVRQLELRKMVTRHSMSYEVVAELIDVILNMPEKVEEHIQYYIDLLIEGVKKGRYTPADHRKQAMIIQDLSIQYLFKWLRLSEEEMEREVKKLTSVLLEGIAVKS